MRKEIFIKLARKISPEFMEEYDLYKESNIIMKNKLNMKELKITSFNKCIEFMKKVKKDYKKNKLLDITFNEKSDTWTVVYIENEIPPREFSIIVTSCTKSHAREVYKLEFEFKDEEQEINITENRAYEKREGYGSIGLQALKELAERLNYKEITGTIESTDWDRVDKLQKFYSEQEFKVNINAEVKSGFIIWENNSYDASKELIKYYDYKINHRYDVHGSRELIEKLICNGCILDNDSKLQIFESIRQAYEIGLGEPKQ